MGKPVRLGKAAGELNVGMSTLIEFLEGKGISISASPNTKLSPEDYELLRTEFAADQTLKEESKKTPVNQEKRETISLRDKKEGFGFNSKKGGAENHRVGQGFQGGKANEFEKKDRQTKSEGAKLQVLGKIDLDSLNTKTRPTKTLSDWSHLSYKSIPSGQ